MVETKTDMGAKASKPKRAPKPKPALRSDVDYRVLDVRDFVMWPADDAVLERLVNGDNIPRSQRRMRKAWTGEIAEGLPTVVVPWMLASGWIVKANGKDDPFRGAKSDDGGDA